MKTITNIIYLAFALFALAPAIHAQCQQVCDVDNTALGYGAFLTTTGNFITAIGGNTLSSNTTGSNNIALGSEAGSNLTTGDDNIYIGNKGVEREAGTIRIGTQRNQRRTAIAGIRGGIVPTGVAVIVDIDGHLG